jgi:hypothetical protein
VSAADTSALEAIGLRPGEGVRFRRAARARWQAGTVRRIERDGSLQVTDADGSARNIALADVWVAVRPGRGHAARWEPLAERSARAVQLTLAW